MKLGYIFKFTAVILDDQIKANLLKGSDAKL